jgi:hypothetical protein
MTNHVISRLYEVIIPLFLAFGLRKWPSPVIWIAASMASFGLFLLSTDGQMRLEVRIGPAGARLGSLAHYHTSSSPKEMSAYYTWRVMEVFQLVDPMQLLSAPN